MSLRHPALWTLAILGVALIVLALVLARVRKARAGTIYRKHFGDDRGREKLLYASLSFSICFAIVRLLTHAIHAGRGPFHDISMGGRHIHHLVWGILLLLLVG